MIDRNGREVELFDKAYNGNGEYMGLVPSVDPDLVIVQNGEGDITYVRPSTAKFWTFESKAEVKARYRGIGVLTMEIQNTVKPKDVIEAAEACRALVSTLSLEELVDIFERTPDLLLKRPAVGASVLLSGEETLRAIVADEIFYYIVDSLDLIEYEEEGVQS